MLRAATEAITKYATWSWHLDILAGNASIRSLAEGFGRGNYVVALLETIKLLGTDSNRWRKEEKKINPRLDT